MNERTNSTHLLTVVRKCVLTIRSFVPRRVQNADILLVLFCNPIVTLNILNFVIKYTNITKNEDQSLFTYKNDSLCL